MDVNRALIDRLATLSKLEFDESAKVAIQQDLKRIFGFIEKISEIDTTGIEPLIYLSDEVNVLRKDEVKTLTTQQEALLNAPLADEQYIKVPKVIKNPNI